MHYILDQVFEIKWVQKLITYLFTYHVVPHLRIFQNSKISLKEKDAMKNNTLVDKGMISSVVRSALDSNYRSKDGSIIARLRIEMLSESERFYYNTDRLIPSQEGLIKKPNRN
jgi:hypothetical protein